MKSRNPSALSNSPPPRRAAALPNNPNRIRRVSVFLSSGYALRCQRPDATVFGMEFGWYHEFHRQVDGQSDADAFAQGFEQVEAADRWGLDVFWLAEIHQQARRSVLSAPMN